MHLEGFLNLQSVVEEMEEEKRAKVKKGSKKKKKRKGKDGVMHSVWDRSAWEEEFGGGSDLGGGLSELGDIHNNNKFLIDSPSPRSSVKGQDVVEE